MMVKSISFFILVFVVLCEVTPQTTKNKENLKCYHCDPTEGNTGIKLKCLQDDDELGELKQCPLSEQLCARGKIEHEGKTVELRRCQLAEGQAGNCQETEFKGNKTKICFCDTDGCNGQSAASNTTTSPSSPKSNVDIISPSFFTIVLQVFIALLILDLK